MPSNDFDEIPFNKWTVTEAALLIGGILLAVLLFGAVVGGVSAICPDGIWVQDVLGLPRCIEQKK